jgi:hypothetical protein
VDEVEIIRCGLKCFKMILYLEDAEDTEKEEVSFSFDDDPVKKTTAFTVISWRWQEFLVFGDIFSKK